MLCVSKECWCTLLHLLNQRWTIIYLLMGNVADCIFCLQVPRSPNTSLMESSMCFTPQSSIKRSPLHQRSRSYTTDLTGYYDICVFTFLFVPFIHPHVPLNLHDFALQKKVFWKMTLWSPVLFRVLLTFIKWPKRLFKRKVINTSLLIRIKLIKNDSKTFMLQKFCILNKCSRQDKASQLPQKS